MPEKITFGEALINIAMQDLSTEKGGAVFDKMVVRAIFSKVPREANSAIQNLHDKVKRIQRGQPQDIETSYKQVATMLFEKELRYPNLSGYAVIYTQTMSILKSWLQIDSQVTQNLDLQRKLEKATKRIKNPIKVEVLTKYINKIETMFQETKPTLQEFKNLAVSSCGNLVMLEEMGRKRTFPAGISERLSGGGFTADDLTKTREEIEEYFSHPTKVARILLLASARK